MDAISRCRNTVQKKGLWWNWKKECVARQRYVYIIIKYAANRDAMQNTLDTNQEIVCLLIELFHEQRLLQVVPLYCFAPCFFSFAQQYSFHTLFILLWNCIIFSTKLHEAVVLFLALDSHCRCKKKKKKSLHTSFILCCLLSFLFSSIELCQMSPVEEQTKHPGQHCGLLCCRGHDSPAADRPNLALGRGLIWFIDERLLDSGCLSFCCTFHPIANVARC